jgi:restriction system protein
MMILDDLLHDFFIPLLLRLPWWIYFLLVIFISIKLYIGNPKHFRKIRSARKSLITLRSIEESAKQFSYIRKINPFVFEEMILTAFKDSGFKIKRNKRYTGDGGIDGRVFINGRVTLIQAKRYKGYITAQHVAEFERICSRRGCTGLFIHSGRTGKQAKANSKVVVIVSGQRMLNLLLAQPDSFQEFS